MKAGDRIHFHSQSGVLQRWNGRAGTVKVVDRYDSRFTTPVEFDNRPHEIVFVRNEDISVTEEGQ